MDKHRATRRPDGKPETPADTRFFDLRESGYTGMIDQDGYKPEAGNRMYNTATGDAYPTTGAHPGLMETPSTEWPRWGREMRGQYAADRMRCPACGEPATHRPPTDLLPWHAHGQGRPAWSHADGSSLCPVIGPGGYQPATPVPAQPPAPDDRPCDEDTGTCDTCGEETRDLCSWCWQCPSCCDCGEMEAPSPPSSPGTTAGPGWPASDSEFLDSCTQLADQLHGIAAAVAGWAEDLAALNLPPAVLSPLHAAAAAITDAAAHLGQATGAFREAFSDARQAAAGGLRITGAGPG